MPPDELLKCVGFLGVLLFILVFLRGNKEPKETSSGRIPRFIWKNPPRSLPPNERETYNTIQMNRLLKELASMEEKITIIDHEEYRVHVSESFACTYNSRVWYLDGGQKKMTKGTTSHGFASGYISDENLGKTLAIHDALRKIV